MRGYGRSSGVGVDRPSIDNLPPAWAYCSALRGASPRPGSARLGLSQKGGLPSARRRERAQAVQGHQLALEGGSNRAAPLSLAGRVYEFVLAVTAARDHDWEDKMTDDDYREFARLSRVAGKALLRMAELFERAAGDARRLEPNPEIDAAKAVVDAALAALDRELADPSTRLH